MRWDSLLAEPNFPIAPEGLQRFQSELLLWMRSKLSCADRPHEESIIFRMVPFFRTNTWFPIIQTCQTAQVHRNFDGNLQFIALNVLEK
mmetsp:Transcript_15290/g.25940  ORF Transcript_15290/g.25940 Transcript_15290/m.25940 type:complete len:89 (+) Transcript_15290:167-433(+)